MTGDDAVEILLVEDDPNDIELALHALKRNNITNKIHIARDGVEALDFIFCTGKYQGRDITGPEAATGRWSGGAKANQR